MRGDVRRVIRDALVSCFDEQELSEFAAARMGVELAHVAGGDDFAQVAWNFVAWAEREGRLEELVRAASLERPQAAAEWARLAELTGRRAASSERLPSMSGYEPSGNGEQRRQGEQLGRLIADVDHLKTDVAGLRADVQRLLSREPWTPGLWYVAVFVVGIVLAAGVMIVAFQP